MGVPDSATEPKTGVEEVGFAPPVPGLSAAPVAKDKFEELYDVYGVRQDKADARRVYEHLDPSDELHAHMVDAAGRWREAGAGIERMRLRRWIEEERYDEDPKGERKPRQKRQFASNDNTPKPRRSKRPVTIVDSTVTHPDGGTLLTLHFNDGSSHNVNLEHRNASEQSQGQRQLASLCKAAGLFQIDNSDELHGLSVTMSDNNGEVEFTPASMEAA